MWKFLFKWRKALLVAAAFGTVKYSILFLLWLFGWSIWILTAISLAAHLGGAIWLCKLWKNKKEKENEKI